MNPVRTPWRLYGCGDVVDAPSSTCVTWGHGIKISLKFVSKGQMNNIPSLVQIMAWRGSAAKPLSEPMMVSLPMHI